jgi:uncharacterized Fe-S cluster protein YjdI
MPLETLKYTNGEVTVVWKPKVCIHSTLCWKGLLDVFNPSAKPWINMQGAATDAIIEQVRKCPSGALSYFMNDAEASGKEVVAEAAEMTKIEVLPNGPILVKNQCIIKHSDGREELKEGSFALCRCGASASKPYCDGSHKQIGFEG